jgi:hypothetical protein
MKTKPVILATILVFAAILATQAATPQKTMTIFGINGRSVEMPIKVEEAVDDMPVELAMALEAEREQRIDSLLNQRFDLSQITKPEPDADDITINTRAIFIETIVRERLDYMRANFSKK